jgi:hypothetical protein
VPASLPVDRLFKGLVWNIACQRKGSAAKSVDLFFLLAVAKAASDAFKADPRLKAWLSFF